jgi:uncharacterized protein with PIN domain
MEFRECPLCGGTMQLRQSEVVVQVPGNPNTTMHRHVEWICPDCDYFEDPDEEKD